MQSKPHFPAFPLLLISIMTFCCVNADSQSCGQVISKNEELQVASLPSTVAASKSNSDVLVASVATAVLDPALCCGRNSALEDPMIAASSPTGGEISLRAVGQRLRGKHYLGDGTPISVADQYWPGAPIEQNSVQSGDVIASLLAQRPLLMNWDGHLYVVYGAIYDVCAGGDPTYSGNRFSISTLLLIDTRFSGPRRYVSFKPTDNWGKVTGFLALAIARNK